jgi:CheY-like chemotaxis protein
MPSLLVVDDNRTVRATLTLLLEGEGYEVRTAVNGRDALAEARRDGPSVILLDLHMPILDGWGFLQERGQDARLLAIPVIALSADVEDLLASTLNLGADAALLKHGDLDTMLAAVERLSRCTV